MSVDWGPSVGDVLFLQPVSVGAVEAPLAAVEEEDKEQIEPCCPMHLYWPTVAFIGTQMSWAAQIGYVTPTLRSLGVPTTDISFIWLVGPAAGILVQPLIGVYSDHTTLPLGRRRIYIIIGGILSTIGLIGFSNATAIDAASGNSSLGLAVAILCFVFMDFSINASQAVQRPLLADVVKEEDQLQAHGFFAMNNGVGKMLGYGLGALSLTSFVLLSWLKTQVRALFTLTAIVLATTTILCVVNVHEQQLVLPPGERIPTLVEAVTDVVESVRNIPRPIFRAFAVQFCAYSAWYTIYIYASDWMGEDVFLGDPDADDDSSDYQLFETGVEMASFGLLLAAALSVAWSVLLPLLIKRAGLKLAWALNLAVLCIALICTVTVSAGQVDRAVFVLALLGFPMAATYQIPWTIVTLTVCMGEGRTKKAAGRYATVFNLSQCIPEIVISLLAGPVITLFDGKIHGAFVLGGCFAAIGVGLCYFLEDPLAQADPVTKEEIIHPRLTKITHRRKGSEGEAGEATALISASHGGATPGGEAGESFVLGIGAAGVEEEGSASAGGAAD